MIVNSGDTESEYPILNKAIGVIAEEGINAIPDLVQTNDKSETKTKTPITNEGSSSAGSSKEKNIHVEFWETQLYSPNEKRSSSNKKIHFVWNEKSNSH